MITKPDNSLLIDCLTQLGYSKDHELIKTLNEGEKVDLNKPDKAGLTPLRIAIQKKAINTIKTLLLYEPNPKHLSPYDEAFICDLENEKAIALKNLPLILNPNNITDAMRVLYPEYLSLQEGACFGIGQMRRQAFHAGEGEVFSNRLKNIQYNVMPIIDQTIIKIKKKNTHLNVSSSEFLELVREKLVKRFPYSVWTDLYAFLDGILVSQIPKNFSFLFEPGTNLEQLELPGELLLRPIALEVKEKSLTPIDTPEFLGAYNEKTLDTYFECLDRAFYNVCPLSFGISIGDHYFTIDYNQGKWHYTNYFSEEGKEYSSQEIAKLLLKNYPTSLVFVTTPSIAPNTSGEIIKKYNQALKNLNLDSDWCAIHKIEKNSPLQKNSNGLNLLHLAAKHGHLEVAQEVIEAFRDKVDVLNALSNKGYTPLQIAFSYGNYKIVELLVEAFEGNIEALCNPINVFYLSAQEGNVPICSLFLDNKAILDKPIQASTEILINLAITVQREVEVCQLLMRKKIGEQLPGFTPLQGALFYGNKEIVSMLLKAGASLEPIEGGISCYELALAMNRIEMLPADYVQREQEKEAALQFKHQTMIKESIQLLERFEEKCKTKKNQLSPNDREAQLQFIQMLKEELNAFEFFDENENILTIIEANIARFPDLRMQTLLHKITLKLIDDTPKQDLSEEAQKILEVMKQSIISSYVKKLNKLYAKLEEMQALTTVPTMEKQLTLVELATVLKSDVNFFVCQHSTHIPSNEAFNRFKTKFDSRLHSQDLKILKESSYSVGQSIYGHFGCRIKKDFIKEVQSAIDKTQRKVSELQVFRNISLK